jgi:RNA polymerase subunit RPABC4/transcription elongation factor Spt4
MFGWLRKQTPPRAPKRCSQCDTEMDADETVCPECGHGAKEQLERQEKAKAKSQPAIDMSDLTKEWAGMRPAARRHVMRARVLGTDRGLAARLRKLLGIAWRPTPPTARRVAARAMALAAVVWRAQTEMNLKDIPRESWNPLRDHILTWLKALGILGELEPHERTFFDAPLGHGEPQLMTNAARRVEGLAVLAWALNRIQLPAYDDEAVPLDRALLSIGLEDLQTARQLLDSATLRPAAEIEQYATHATVVSWRLRTFQLYPGPWDLLGHLRRHTSFREAWLQGLRIVDGDLAIGTQSIANAPPEKVRTCEWIAVERQIAAYWLEGDDRVYSKVDPATLLTAC